MQRKKTKIDQPLPLPPPDFRVFENFWEFLPQNAGKTHFFRGFWPKNGKNSRLRRKKSRFIAFLPHFTPLYPLFWTFYNPCPPTHPPTTPRFTFYEW